jgi:hypothetical protein
MVGQIVLWNKLFSQQKGGGKWKSFMMMDKIDILVQG